MCEMCDSVDSPERWDVTRPMPFLAPAAANSSASYSPPAWLTFSIAALQDPPRAALSSIAAFVTVRSSPVTSTSGKRALICAMSSNASSCTASSAYISLNLDIKSDANSICSPASFSKPALSYTYLDLDASHWVDDAKSTPSETSLPSVNPRFSHALAAACSALSLSSLGAHPPSSPFPPEKPGSDSCRIRRSSECTSRFVRMASCTVSEPVAQISISCMSGVPGPACAPPPSMFPSGNGNLYRLAGDAGAKADASGSCSPRNL